MLINPNNTKTKTKLKEWKVANKECEAGTSDVELKALTIGRDERSLYLNEFSGYRMRSPEHE